MIKKYLIIMIIYDKHLGGKYVSTFL